MDLTDRVIVVSGGSGGIGFASAGFILDHGGVVVVADATPLSAAQRERVASHGDRVLEIACDVTRVTDAEAVADGAVARFGHIDGIVNSAGIDRHHDLLDLTADEFGTILDINVLGSFRLTQAVVRRMVASPRTHPRSYGVVHMSSVNAVIGTPTHVAYATSKGAIAQMTRVMAVELAPHGIRVNAVGPGTVHTQMLDDLLRYKPDALASIIARTPLGRLGDTTEIAAVVGFLLSDHASYITGQTIYVDGGRTVQNLTL